MLYQAFLNILINAFQAMPDGGETIIETFTRDENIIIKFTDNGCGIKDGTFIKIWDPFFTTKEKGTGLGLLIVKNIIDAHKGKIQIENLQPHEQGVCVTIELPSGHGD